MGQNPREELMYVRRQRLQGEGRGSRRWHHWRRIPWHGIMKYRRWPRYQLLHDRRGGGRGPAEDGVDGTAVREPLTMKARRKASSFQTACFP
ncbi:hypothetical protein E2C01_088981 [Portunus trituberculatus]|uniref:Uncharacterized protein n=1 Tax=Portunus trituberculatus TaxID=210409 RepID=A0A5B7JL12_PORTR|nr:hypothetical protein [Portunus trituberculatus]